MIGCRDGFPNFTFKIGQVVPGELRQAILTIVIDLGQAISGGHIDIKAFAKTLGILTLNNFSAQFVVR